MSSFNAGDTESIPPFTTQSHSVEANACIEYEKTPQLCFINELIKNEFKHCRHYFEIVVAAAQPIRTR